MKKIMRCPYCNEKLEKWLAINLIICSSPFCGYYRAAIEEEVKESQKIIDDYFEKGIIID